MKKNAALVVALGFLAACGEQEHVREPQTPQEMYERVRELLQPNVEHDASEFSEAMMWLRRAAEGGLLQAQTDLGGIYLEGGKNGEKPDGKEAYYWFSKAAEQGSREALYYMGLILHRGMNMPKDEAKARGFWLQAAEKGVAEAQFALGIALAREAATTRQGVQWLTQAAAAPIPKLAAQAACALGNIYATGKNGIAQDMPEAARWYEIAARGGEASAQLVYAIMLLQGEPVAQDTQQGMQFLRMAAGQDSPQAIALLVNLLRNGDAAEENEQEANAWMDRLDALQRKAAAPANGARSARE